MKKAIEYFLYRVDSLEDLPAPVAEIVRSADDPSPTILVVPPQEYPIFHEYRFFSIAYGERTTPQRTLVFGANRLLVIEREATLRQISIPYEALVSVEVTIVLLYAYVTFTWISGDALETLKIEYNAVGESLIRAEAQRIRATKPRRERTLPDETEAILKALPIKFRNYLRFSLLPDEQVFSAAFQPAITAPRRTLRRRLSGDRTVALTSAGITIVEEEASHILNYGVKTRYFPLGSIERVDFEPKDDLIWMHVRLHEREIRVPLSGENGDALLGALARFLPSIPASMSEATLVPAGAL